MHPTGDRNPILRRIDRIISQFGEANEENESEYYVEVNQILNQVEIYDHVWYARHAPENGKHSDEAVILVKEILEKLKNIPDGCAECFPFRKNISDSQDYSEAGMRQFSPGC